MRPGTVPALSASPGQQQGGLKPPVNRKMAIYIASGLGALVMIAILMLFVAKNPEQAREQKLAAAKQAAIEKLQAGTPSAAQRAINTESNLAEQQIGNTKSLYDEPLPGAPSKPAAASTANLPPLNGLELKQLDEAYQATGKKAGFGNAGVSGPAMKFTGTNAGSGSDGVYEDYGKAGAVPNAAQATGMEAQGGSGKPGTYPAISPLNAPADRILTQGTLIRATLAQPIDTRNPGSVIGVVTQNVYDSLDEQTLLIPKGSRLVGSYQIKVEAGADQIPVTFRRLELPDGRAIDLGAMQAVNYAGISGIDGSYHSNILHALGPSLVVALIGTGIDRLGRKGQSQQDQSTPYGTVVQSPSVAEQMAPQVNQQVMQRYSSAVPYFTVKAGAEFKVFTTKDIIIPAPDVQGAQAASMPQAGVWEGGQQ